MDINAAASNAGSVKAVLDVPILTEDGGIRGDYGEDWEAVVQVTRKRSKMFFARVSSRKRRRIPIRSLRYSHDIHTAL